MLPNFAAESIYSFIHTNFSTQTQKMTARPALLLRARLASFLVKFPHDIKRFRDRYKRYDAQHADARLNVRIFG